ncbi:MAG: class I adenylate-forming enzyme family protein [Thermodesulfobacteriota bacterium]
MTWGNLSQTWHFVEKWAQTKPEAEALIFENQRLTWKSFKNHMDSIAKAYLEAGVQKGDRVALLSMARTEFPLTYMAAGKVGAVWLGLSPKFTLDELRYLVGHGQPRVLIAVRDFQGQDLAATISALRQEFECLQKVLVIGEPLSGTEGFEAFTSRPRPNLDDALAERSASVNPEDEALLLYTSGSTGQPKGVIHTHRSIVENIKVQVAKFRMTEKDRMLCHFPINHVAADTEIGVGSIMAGCALVLMDRFDPLATLEIIEKEKVTGLGQVPVMFLLEFKEPSFFQRDLSSLTHFLWAGAAAPKIMIDVLDMIRQKTGTLMLTGYGSTETCGFVTYTDPADDLATLQKTVGRMADPFELKVVDTGRQEVPDGRVGEIAVRGPFLMKGYYKNPEATAQVIDAAGWYYTADLGYKDPRGNIILVGRTSEMYKSGGENVYPREIEELLESHPAVLFAAVISVPDELYQEVGWAYIMLKPGQNVGEEDLRELCQDKLANFKVPKRFFIRPLLPLLASGKVNKMALKEEAQGRGG